MCDVVMCVPCLCVAMPRCVWRLRVCVRKWATAMATALRRVMPLVCNCDIMRISSVCDYTEVGEVPV